MAKYVPSLLALLTATALAGAVVPTATHSATADEERLQLLRVKTPTHADKQRLQKLDLDLTESGGKNFIDVVSHGQASLNTLKRNGFQYTVTIPDLAADEKKVAQKNAAYAAATTTSALPSGRDRYRTLNDYTTDMQKLVKDYPKLVKPIQLAETTLEGRPVQGIEISNNAKKADDGRPTFLLMGAHHAREWPSGEMSMEFAIDLVHNYGHNDRITNLLKRARVIVVPVVNADGFTHSISDGTGVTNGGNEYKRKNCRIVDGAIPVVGECAASDSPSGYGAGIDLNRNYAGMWGGPGAESSKTGSTYRGPAPFSEPESRNVRELVSKGEVTMLVTNHTYSNLVLRPGGLNPKTLGPDGQPVGVPYDDARMKVVGDKMAAQNGYSSLMSWQLYDTTGTTEEWSYAATGGYGYTFEIGASGFHPEFAVTVAEYTGAGAYAGKGNREAYLIALEAAVDPKEHSVLSGTGAPGTTLRLEKKFKTSNWAGKGSIAEHLNTTTTIGANGKFTWHVNPSTRPDVVENRDKVTNEGADKTQTLNVGQLSPGETYTTTLTATEDTDLLAVTANWYLKPDLDVEIFKGNKLVASSKQLKSQTERALLAPKAGNYKVQITNNGNTKVHPEVNASWYQTEVQPMYPFAEGYTLTCERDGKALGTTAVDVERGQQVKVALPQECE